MIDHGPYEDDIRQTVAAFCRTYPSDPADMYQDVIADFYDPKFQERLDAVTGDEPDMARSRYVTGMARKVCGRTGLSDKASAEGFAVADIYRYGHDQVELLISWWYDRQHDGGMPAGGSTEARVSSTPSPVAETGGTMAALIDIDRVMGRFAVHEVDFLKDTIWHEYRQADLAAELGVSEQAIGQRKRRLVDRAVRLLNDYRRTMTVEHDGPGSRTAMSNETARRMTA